MKMYCKMEFVACRYCNDTFQDYEKKFTRTSHHYTYVLLIYWRYFIRIFSLRTIHEHMLLKKQHQTRKKQYFFLLVKSDNLLRVYLL
jgi:hypothetical protein